MTLLPTEEGAARAKTTSKSPFFQLGVSSHYLVQLKIELHLNNHKHSPIYSVSPRQRDTITRVPKNF